jgi:Na+/H+ antiporter NhaC
MSILLRSSFEALLIGCIAGFIILAIYNHTNVFTDFVESTIRVIGDTSSGGSVWVILVCGLYGSLIALMVRSGGLIKFGEWALKFIKTRKQALMGTWLVGLIIFLDDYLSELTVGLSMRKITDTFKIPREVLAYMVNATAAAWSVIAPISTWTIYIGALLVVSKAAPEGEGLQTYWKMIPFICYGYIAVILSALFASGVLPWFGKLKKAVERAETTGRLTAGTFSSSSALDVSAMNPNKEAKLIYFVLPMLVALVATIFFDIDALKGVIIAVAFTFIYYRIFNVGSFQQLSDTMFSGVNSMVLALSILMMSYVLKDINTRMGLTEYVLNGVTPYVSKELLPLAIFLSMALISVTTGSSWGLYAVALPLIVPLAQELDANVLLSCGAAVSAGVMGSNSCPYSDATILTSQSCESPPLDNSLSQLPYIGIVFVLSCMAYVVFGYFL